MAQFQRFGLMLNYGVGGWLSPRKWSRFQATRCLEPGGDALSYCILEKVCVCVRYLMAGACFDIFTLPSFVV